MPLHPAVVHFPLVLAMMMPLVVLVAMAFRYRDKLSRTPAIIVLALTALLAITSYIAVETGEDEEHVVEDVIAKAPLDEHEDHAELFLTMSFVLLGLGAVAVPLSRHKAGLPAMSLVLVVSLATAAQGLRTGETGGELVYVHGAAQAYTSGNVAPSDGAKDKTKKERKHSD